MEHASPRGDARDGVEPAARTHRTTLKSKIAIAAALAFLAVSPTACGGDGGPARSYSIGIEVADDMQEYEYLATDPVDVRVGDEVTFELSNTGALPHDLNIVDPDGRTIARAEPVPSGGTASVTATFEQPGFYRISCFVDDHLIEHQMFTFVEVTDPDA